MQEGLVVHIEDSESFRDSVEDGMVLFSDGRHQVVGGASTLKEAHELLDRIHKDEVRANIVLLDGDLDEGRTGNDAREISTRIRELRLPLRIIGAGNDTMESYGLEVDADVPKPVFSAALLVQTIDVLPEPEAVPGP